MDNRELDSDFENWAPLHLVPDVVEPDEYPELAAISLIHLGIVRQYAEKAHAAFRIAPDDEDALEPANATLRSEYFAILNYSSSRIYCNSAAMMMPLVFQDWNSTQFSDDMRMITHAVVHGHYRTLATDDYRDHATVPRILSWCRHLGITTSEKTLRTHINNGIADGMFEEVSTGKGHTKGVMPSTKCQDMYQASSCLYASLLGTRWLGVGGEVQPEVLRLLTSLNPDGVFQDIAIITRGVVRAFKEAGIDFIAMNRPLPRFGP